MITTSFIVIKFLMYLTHLIFKSWEYISKKWACDQLLAKQYTIIHHQVDQKWKPYIDNILPQYDFNKFTQSSV